MNQSTKRGQPRKSRRARLPLSVVWGQRYQCKPSEKDWKRIEVAYPFISLEDRAPIARLVADYLSREPYERCAPFLNDATDWPGRTEKAAKVFHQAITELPSPERHDAIYAARGLVERRIRHCALPEGLEWHTLHGIMVHLIAAFDVAKRLLPTQAAGGFVEGQSWDVLICKLSDFVKSKRYPTGASKGVDKSNSEKPSSFVAFIRELQHTLPEQCRRHSASDVALAEAITVARRKQRKVKSVNSVR